MNKLWAICGSTPGPINQSRIVVWKSGYMQEITIHQRSILTKLFKTEQKFVLAYFYVDEKTS